MACIFLVEFALVQPNECFCGSEKHDLSIVGSVALWFCIGKRALQDTTRDQSAPSPVKMNKL